MSDGSPPAKRQRYQRHHVIRHKPQQVPTSEPAITDQKTLDILLLKSITAICVERATSNNVPEPVVDDYALNALRDITEKYILKLCMTVRRSMQATRRTTPIATDFELVAQALDEQIPIDQLGSYQTLPAVNPPLLPTPPPDDVFHNCEELPRELLGPELDGAVQSKKDKFIPSTLPFLPSVHTYKATPVYSIREKDPRRIRELATEEGKMGEQALRKLAGAMKLEKTISTEAEVRPPPFSGTVPDARRRRMPQVSEEAMFEETMRALLATQSSEDQSAFEVGPVVSAEKRFWRPDDNPMKRRAVNTSGAPPVGGGDVSFEL